MLGMRFHGYAKERFEFSMSSRSRIVLFVFGLVLICAKPSAAQNHPSRAWADLSIGIATAAEKSLTTEASYQDGSGEFSDFRTTYNAPRGASFDIGFGYMFSNVLGAGIALGGTAHKAPADLFIRIPHPNFFNRHATDEAETSGDLDRAEGSVHFQVVVRPVHSEKASLRFFAGPSYFRLTQDAVTDIRYVQVWLGTLNEVGITTHQTSEVEATGWGFHVGADLSYFFTNAFGLGVAGKVSRGTVEISDSGILTADGPFDVKVGGFQFGGGLRFRF